MMGGDNDKEEKTKRKVGRMERTAEIKAPLRKVYRVITDFQHYSDWSGNGIKKCTIKQQRPGMLEMDYTTGAFGVQFQFSLYWGLGQANKVSFRTSKSTRMLRFIKGEYTLTKLRNDRTQVHFVIMADVPAPIPFFLKMAIAKILVRIAVNDLKQYLESEECTANLAKYDKLEKSTLLHTVRNRVTQMVTQVPGLLPAEGQPVLNWLKVALLRGASLGGRLAAGWLVVSNLIWGANMINRQKEKQQQQQQARKA